MTSESSIFPTRIARHRDDGSVAESVGGVNDERAPKPKGGKLYLAFTRRRRERGFGMAAIRSALALLGRRSCGPSRSAAVASLGGTRLEMQQVFRPAAPPLSSLLPVRHSVESYRRLSTGGGRVPVDKAENLWQRCMYRIKNADLEQKTKFCFWYSMVVLVGSSAFYMLKTRKLIRHM